jgi:hypothetical protein
VELYRLVSKETLDRVAFSMFSLFPDGWSGFGLLLLRAVLGSALTIGAWEQIRVGQNVGMPVLVMLLLAFAAGILVTVGYRTRAVATVSAVAIVLMALLKSASIGHVVIEYRLVAILLTVIAAAIACVGPGAFSLDSHFFGRREIMIPKNPPGPI